MSAEDAPLVQPCRVCDGWGCLVEEVSDDPYEDQYVPCPACDGSGTEET